MLLTRLPSRHQGGKFNRIEEKRGGRGRRGGARRDVRPLEAEQLRRGDDLLEARRGRPRRLHLAEPGELLRLERVPLHHGLAQHGGGGGGGGGGVLRAQEAEGRGGHENVELPAATRAGSKRRGATARTLHTGPRLTLLSAEACCVRAFV